MNYFDCDVVDTHKNHPLFILIAWSDDANERVLMHTIAYFLHFIGNWCSPYFRSICCYAENLFLIDLENSFPRHHRFHLENSTFLQFFENVILVIKNVYIEKCAFNLSIIMERKLLRHSNLFVIMKLSCIRIFQSKYVLKIKF